MRNAPLNFFKQKDKQQYDLFSLVVLEASYVYVATVESDSSKTEIIVDSTVKEILNDSGYDFTSSGDGYCWTLTFESGANVGAMRKVESWDSVTGTFTIGLALDKEPGTEPDRIRIAKNLFLSGINTSVNFYLPDESYGDDVEMVYVPFPMKITPMGTKSNGEIMTLDISISAVDKAISNAIQSADGLQGNMVTHLRVFSSVLNQGKEYCIKDSSYIDTVTISPEEIKFSLESKYNIVDVQLPQCTYTRDFCRFKFKGEECGWTLEGSGEGHGYYVRYDSVIPDKIVFDFPLVQPNSCDHTLNGPNGCVAHNNRLRFGGFPALNSG